MKGESYMSAPNVAVSERVQTILDHRHDHYDRQEIARRDQIYREIFAQYPDALQAIRFAKGFEAFLEQKKILIKEYDLLAGFAYRYTYETTLAVDMPVDFDPQFRPPSYMAPFREAEDCIRQHGYPEDSEDAQELRVFAKGITTWLFKHWESGHIIPGVKRLFDHGFGGLIEIGKASLEKQTDPERRQFLEAMLICDEAAAQYILRYRDLARDLAKQTEQEEYRAQLEKMAAALDHIAYGKPRSFYEAMQLLWLMHEMVYCETYPASVSFGRLDKYLYPYYQADLAANRITREEAADLMDALWIKFGTTLHAYQNITIGGLDGADGFLDNDITYMMLHSTRKLRFDQPLISLRYNDAMPESMWDEAIALIKTGIGFPAFFYDNACIQAKLDLGHEMEDAQDYGLIGCVEMAVPGKEYSKTEVLRVNWGQVLELMLNDGKCTCSDDAFALHHPHKLEDIQSFEEFYDWYKEELAEFTRLSMRCINRLDESVAYCYPTPYLSTLMEGCLECGMDVTGGGTKYNNTGINACGMANAADSLAAIEKLVFQEKKLTLAEFAEALRHNYEGYEDLYYEVTTQCPKYGNDDAVSDAYLADLVEMFSGVVKEFTNPRGGKFQLGLYSVEDHSKMGIHTGALPDGKLKGAALANAISPVQGRDITGPTAVVNSVLKTDLSAATNGMVLDLKFSPSFFDNKRHEEALKALIKTYFKNGGMEIQFNVVDRATLLDAQQHPEKHKDLVVRVSGFSAYFTSLIKETQDEIIARTEYSAM